MTSVTKHAKERLKERAGIKTDASCQKRAERALMLGVAREETAGNLYKYLTHLYCTHENMTHLRVFNYQVYIFDEDRLVTVLDLPCEHKKAFDKARRKKQEGAEPQNLDPQTEERRVESMTETGLTQLLTIENMSEYPVSGRELHGRLGVDTRYNDWIKRMIDYGFEAGKDFRAITQKRVTAQGNETTQEEHKLTLSMAKELAMLQRTDKGREVRRYLIQVEEAWNSPDAIMARALHIAHDRVKTLQGELLTLQVENSQLAVETQIMRPKAAYFDDLVDRGANLSIRETAKELGLKERAFVDHLLKRKYLYRDGKGKLMPFAQHVHGGLFEVKECLNERTQWTGTQTLITPKGREAFRHMTEGLTCL